MDDFGLFAYVCIFFSFAFCWDLQLENFSLHFHLWGSWILLDCCWPYWSFGNISIKCLRFIYSFVKFLIIIDICLDVLLALSKWSNLLTTKLSFFLQVAIFVLVGIVLAGAALGYWIVRKFVISKDGTVDVGVAQFVKWAMRIIASTSIFQVCCCINVGCDVD